MAHARMTIAALAATIAAAVFALPAVRSGAQPAAPLPGAKPEMMENCPGLVARNETPRVLPASLKGDEVRISYAGHSTFMVESPGGIKIATDYNDYVKPRALPDIATMNHADRKSTRLNSSHMSESRMPSSA